MVRLFAVGILFSLSVCIGSQACATDYAQPSPPPLGEDSGLRYPGDENWWGGFGSGGTDTCATCAILYEGDLVVGGCFREVDGQAARRIARRDDDGWHTFGAGMNDVVRALAVYNGELIAAGSFTYADGRAAARIARWDGATWQPLGAGLNAPVYSLCAWNGLLYVGGAFTTAGGVSASHVATWNGSGWSHVAAGVNDDVYTMAEFNETLYVGGAFTQAGGWPASYLAMTDGALWAPVGSGMNSVVRALAVFQGNLYAGGAFTSAGGVTASRIARFDSFAWHDVGGGVDSDVYALLNFAEGFLMVGGDFISGGGHTLNRIAVWSETTGWYPLGSGVDSRVVGLLQQGGEMIAVGNFAYASGSKTYGIARWSFDHGWTGIGQGLSLTSYPGEVRAMVVYQGDLIVGGVFTYAGGRPIGYIARWDGTTWRELGGSANNGVDALLVHAGELVATGSFTTIGGVTASRIARWNGTTWSPLGTGLDSQGKCLCSYEGDLVVGGQFQHAGGIAAVRVARWDGSNWHAMSSGFNSIVRALLCLNGTLYAGGHFTDVGGDAYADYLAKWTGTAWSHVSTLAPSDAVSSLGVYQGDLVVGGGFATIGGQAVNYLARWNGYIWSPFGSGMDSSVGHMLARGSDLFVGGIFTQAGNSYARGMALWDGAAWRPLGSGMTWQGSDGPAQAMLEFGGHLYVGGWTWSAGSVPSHGIARWDLGAPFEITSITDVGNDQGRQVRLAWTREAHDQPGIATITSYAVWRRIDGRASAPASESAGGRTPPGDWEFVLQVPASCLESYTTTCPTLCDSTLAQGACWSAFFVRAMTAEPSVYYETAPDSGYSVDNLAPAAPTGLGFEQPFVFLWDGCPEPDFNYFTVYGSEHEVLDETAVILGYTTTPEMDLTGQYHAYYHVTATDFAGNEGPAGTAPIPQGVDEESSLPRQFALRLAGASPFCGEMTLTFDLPRAATVHLDVHDVLGRRVAVLADGQRAPGRYRAVWNGRADSGAEAPAGVYFVRFEGGEHSAVRRILRIK